MHPAFQKMLDFNRQHQESKDVYRKMQLWHLKNNNGNGVFCPLLEVMASSQVSIINYYTKTFDETTLFYNTNLHLYGTWRNSLGIYKIDDDVIDDVLKSPIPADTPISIFERLPECCVYMDLSNADVFIANRITPKNTTKILGFWALLDLAETTKKHTRVLRLVIHTDDECNVNTHIELAIDNANTVQQAITTIYQNHYQLNDEGMHDVMNAEFPTARLLLSCLLWLCADEPDITGITGEPIPKNNLRLPRYTVNKKTGAFIPPSQPFFYEIGRRFGGEIRTYNEKIGRSDSRVSSQKRPHIRRGHWHGYWHGMGQSKEFKVKWLPMTFVNANA